MRSSSGALLVILGLLLLWLAISGRFDRLAAAWEYVTAKTDTLPADGSASGSVATVAPAAWHVGEMVAALPTIVSLTGA